MNFLKKSVRPDFNFKANHLKLKPTTISKFRDLLQQSDLKQLNLNGRCKCSEKKGTFYWVYLSSYNMRRYMFLYVIVPIIGILIKFYNS